MKVGLCGIGAHDTLTWLTSTPVGIERSSDVNLFHLFFKNVEQAYLIRENLRTSLVQFACVFQALFENI